MLSSAAWRRCSKGARIWSGQRLATERTWRSISWRRQVSSWTPDRRTVLDNRENKTVITKQHGSVIKNALHQPLDTNSLGDARFNAPCISIKDQPAINPHTEDVNVWTSPNWEPQPRPAKTKTSTSQDQFTSGGSTAPKLMILRFLRKNWERRINADMTMHTTVKWTLQNRKYFILNIKYVV